MSTLVYKYHLRAPIERADEVTRQLRLAQRYQHTLTTIERARRRAYVAARRRLVGDLDLAERVLETARAWRDYGRDYVAQQHQDRRSKRTTKDERTRVTQLRDVVTARADVVRALKAEARTNPALLAEATAIEERAKALRLGVRAALGPSGQGLHWGSYQLVEQACDAGRRGSADPSYRPRVSHGYTHWDDPHVDGQLSVQITGGGIPAQAVTGGADTRVRLVPMPREQWPTSRGAGKGKVWMLLYLRVGSEGRSPVWAVWPCKVHRPLPEGAVVKRATVTAKRRGLRTDWSLEVTISTPEATPTSNPRRIAINVGWRVRREGLRVAYLVDDDGAEREVLLDPGVLWLQEKERELRSVIDDSRNLTIRYLRTWLSTSPDVPPWFASATKSIAQWRSNHRMVRFAERWRDARFAGDERIFSVLWLFRERWRHLSQWANGCNRRAQVKRREQYRRLAAELSKDYGTVIFDDANHQQLTRTPQVEQAEDEAHEIVRRNRRAASPGELRDTIETKARMAGVQVRRVAAKNLTHTCFEHGEPAQQDAGQHLRLTYACGCTRDQDRNACLNALARERSGDAWDPAAARKPRKRSRFDRSKGEPEAAE